MKYLLLPVLAAAVYAFNIDVQVTGVASHLGVIKIALYQDASQFGSMTHYLDAAAFDAKKEPLFHRFENLSPGIYAVAVVHDENANGILDRNFFGIPVEGYGFSTNPDVMFRAPAFHDCRFELESDTNLTVMMRY